MLSALIRQALLIRKIKFGHVISHVIMIDRRIYIYIDIYANQIKTTTSYRLIRIIRAAFVNESNAQLYSRHEYYMVFDNI